MEENTYAHPSATLIREKLINKVQEAVRRFLHPFTSDGKGRLLILWSGDVAYMEVQNYVLRAETATKEDKKAS